MIPNLFSNHRYCFQKHIVTSWSCRHPFFTDSCRSCMLQVDAPNRPLRMPKAYWVMPFGCFSPTNIQWVSKLTFLCQLLLSISCSWDFKCHFLPRLTATATLPACSIRSSAKSLWHFWHTKMTQPTKNRDDTLGFTHTYTDQTSRAGSLDLEWPDS